MSQSILWLTYGLINRGTVVRFPVGKTCFCKASRSAVAPPCLLLEGKLGILRGGKAAVLWSSSLTPSKLKRWSDWSRSSTAPCARTNVSLRGVTRWSLWNCSVCKHDHRIPTLRLNVNHFIRSIVSDRLYPVLILVTLSSNICFAW